MSTGAIPFLLFLVLPVGIVLAAVFALPALVEGRRRKAYAAFSLARGYQYVPARPDATAPYLDIVDIFKSGAKRSWRDEISGQFDSKPFTAFEYQYVSGAGRGRTVFSRAMIHWQVDGAALPAFSLVPSSSYLFRVGHAPNDLDFRDDPAFSKAYVLKGPDQAAVRALFTPSLRAKLTDLPGQFLSARGADLFWWREQRLPPPEGIDRFLGDGDRIRDLVVNR